MIVEDQLDRCVGRIRGIEELEEFNEFAAAVAVLDEGEDLAGEQIDAGHKLTVPWRLYSWSRAKVACLPGSGGRSGGRGDCLNAGLLIVGDNRHRIARFLFCGRRRLLDELHFAIDAQNLRHLLLELRIAAFQVVADLVRLYLLFIEDFAQRALSQLGKASVPLSRPTLLDGGQAVASSTIRGDSRGPWPCGRRCRQPMPWPRR